MKQEEGRLLVSAWIDLDFGITDPGALEGFMAHEMGHGLGLWDCPDCKKKQSLMNSFPGINKNNGLVVPSSCDVVTMRNLYQEERQIATLLPSKLVESGSASTPSMTSTVVGEKAMTFTFGGQSLIAAGAAAEGVSKDQSSNASIERFVLQSPSLLDLTDLNSLHVKGPQLYRSLISNGRTF
jgi:hypothetical protein